MKKIAGDFPFLEKTRHFKPVYSAIVYKTVLGNFRDLETGERYYDMDEILKKGKDFFFDARFIKCIDLYETYQIRYYQLRLPKRKVLSATREYLEKRNLQNSEE